MSSGASFREAHLHKAAALSCDWLRSSDCCLANRKIVLVEVSQWDSRIRNVSCDEHGEEACEQREGPGEFRPRCGGITGAGGFTRYFGRDHQDNPYHRDWDPRDNLYLLATPGTPLADNVPVLP